MPIRFREAAIVDLDQIFEFSFVQFGLETALAYRAGLDHVFALIEGNTGLGPVSEIVDGGVRSFAFKSHRIYYRIEHNDVVVARILHKAQAISEKLTF